jgi:hypothetical protein
VKLARLHYQPGALLEFFQESLESLGALCERTWHDRLAVVAEGRAARLWDQSGQLVEKALRFAALEDAAPRQAETEVFPGCPLTFRLAEALGAGGLALERAIVQETEKSRAPSPDVAERVWRVQFPGAGRWRQESNFAATWHCSLVALARCEIQAIEQHWSLHRLAISLPDGRPDPELGENFGLLQIAPESKAPVSWPSPDPVGWAQALQRALREDLAADIEAVRQRQENHLRRELERVDDYFADYEQELTGRIQRSRSLEVKTRLAQRRAAAQAEHERRRADQVQRHEVRVIPHVDALLLLAEPAWSVSVVITAHDEQRPQPALWLPRTRRWK